MAGRKKGAAKSAKTAPPASADRAASGKDVLHGSVFHGGRMYSSKRKGDAAALAKALESEKDAARRKANAEAMQNLANKGRVTGFGTSAAKGKAAAAAKGKGRGRSRAEVEAEGLGEEGEGAGEAVAGGGVEATEEPEE